MPRPGRFDSLGDRRLGTLTTSFDYMCGASEDLAGHPEDDFRTVSSAAPDLTDMPAFMGHPHDRKLPRECSAG